LNFFGPHTQAGFSGSDSDPWSMIDLPNNKIVIKIDGWYLVTLQVNNFNPTGTDAEARVTVYDLVGTAIRFAIEETLTPGSPTTQFGSTAVLQSFATGYKLDIELFHASGSDKTCGPATLSVVRLVPPGVVLST
jgi:hypothetical protein